MPTIIFGSKTRGFTQGLKSPFALLLLMSQKSHFSQHHDGTWTPGAEASATNSPITTSRVPKYPSACPLHWEMLNTASLEAPGTFQGAAKAQGP